MLNMVKTVTRSLGWVLSFTAVFLVLFWPTFRWMAERFEAHDSFYSHGWLIPLATAWLIWKKRSALKQLHPSMSFWGLILMIPSVLIHILASWWDVYFISGFAMVATIWGIVWTFWGWQTLWVLRIPLLFLLFMVPLPGVLLIAISFKMKLMAAQLATQLLSIMGIPAQQAGSTIQLPGMSVVVDDTCSGLRSLISLFALAIFWTQLLGPGYKRWHSMAIMVASVPIALIANMVRILILVLLSIIYGPQVAEGFIHYGSGLVVFGIALTALMGFSRLLVRPTPPSSPIATAGQMVS